MNINQVAEEFRAGHPDMTKAHANLETLRAYRKAAKAYGMRHKLGAIAVAGVTLFTPLFTGPAGVPVAMGGLIGGHMWNQQADQNLHADSDTQIPSHHFSPHAPDSMLADHTRALLKLENGLT